MISLIVTEPEPFLRRVSAVVIERAVRGSSVDCCQAVASNFSEILLDCEQRFASTLKTSASRLGRMRWIRVRWRLLCTLRRHLGRGWLARNAARSQQLLLDLVLCLARFAIIELAWRTNINIRFLSGLVARSGRSTCRVTEPSRGHFESLT